MIGVVADPADHAVVSEFFELFKTPWEFYRRGRDYDVLLCAGDVSVRENTARLVVIYGGQRLPVDGQEQPNIASERKRPCILSYNGMSIPIYGDSITFRDEANGALVDEESRQPAIYLRDSRGKVSARIGYDLFHEVRALLTVGQPPAHASMPALELHITLLRDLIIACGVSLVEIPPVPDGYRFMACLTHDVDHPSIRRHKWDHTTFGFLYRAVFGSLIGVIRGRLPVARLLTNWAAALKLPFVHLGLAKDFWCGFDGYLETEKSLGSSFFVIPFRDDPGRSGGGLAPHRRASSYGAADVASEVRRLVSAGCEVGLHGIDAWLDSSRGRVELDEVRRITGTEEIGVRMHWLYFREGSPSTLEKAGAAYDSSIGYNETVGYRAGTTQAYKPLNATRLLELPLHVMDTALFFPSYLNLSPKEAWKRVRSIVENAGRFGGSVTVNWHDRSIAPERLWGEFYIKLIEELKSKGAWFPTAAQAVSWFRKRRSAEFETLRWEPGSLSARIAADVGGGLPGLRLRIHKAREPRGLAGMGATGSEGWSDIALQAAQ